MDIEQNNKHKPVHTNDIPRVSKRMAYIAAAELAAILIIPHAVAALLTSLGVQYRPTSSYMFMPQIIIDINDGNFLTLYNSSYRQLASYFALLRVVLYYVSGAAILANLYLLATIKFGEDFAVAIRRIGGKSMLWRSAFLYAIVVVGSVYWCFFTGDSLGTKSHPVLFGSLADGLWWLYMPSSMYLAVLFVPLFISTINVIRSGMGETK